ncbi:MAG: UDP-N-acetylmuramoyl-L-alanine--D-glutamate ligase [Erysipelotrichaceae bacterium]|nr:UDP-N-acetylmuramoyl-L-alanine--D-glutamate ligase [Erysipelotrichaceae bacterium]
MKNVLVVGCAKSGFWVSMLLQTKGFAVTITDKQVISNKNKLEEIGIRVFDNGHPDSLINEDWDFIVKNPGIAYHTPFVSEFINRSIPIYTEIEVASWYAKGFRYGAITGTNGKTTTTTILYEMLKRKGNAFASGNIGEALSKTVYDHEYESADIALEVSAFQLLGMPDFRPLVSTITNLTPDHLDYFENIEDYYRAKTLIYKNQIDDDWFILNLDDQRVIDHCVNIKCKIITMSINKEADLMIKDNIVWLFDKQLFDVSTLKIIGRHNIQNAMVAATMAYKMGVDVSDIASSINDFEAIEHRIEYVDTICGVKYYNDSKGTNTDSTIIALRSFNQPVILIAGGYDKHTGFSDLLDHVEKIKTLIVYGATKYELAKLKTDSIICEDLRQATTFAHNVAQANDIVLFSPACASYDQFHDYQQRGDVFKGLIKSIKEGGIDNV